LKSTHELSVHTAKVSQTDLYGKEDQKLNEKHKIHSAHQCERAAVSDEERERQTDTERERKIANFK
jgi:hypothetical protein